VTDIAFHFGAPDKVAYVCRLLRKATTAGKKITVTGEEGILAQLDENLWAVSATDFITHCAAGAPAAMVAHSCVIMAESPQVHAVDASILVNIGADVPPGFAAYERVIEVVSTDAADRDRARLRWKHYTGQGYTIARHDLALKT
jgi:DNA polymerase-3 subunit chi